MVAAPDVHAVLPLKTTARLQVILCLKSILKSNYKAKLRKASWFFLALRVDFQAFCFLSFLFHFRDTFRVVPTSSQRLGSERFFVLSDVFSLLKSYLHFTRALPSGHGPIKKFF
jgi:hypothetical protein